LLLPATSFSSLITAMDHALGRRRPGLRNSSFGIVEVEAHGWAVRFQALTGFGPSMGG